MRTAMDNFARPRLERGQWQSKHCSSRAASTPHDRVRPFPGDDFVTTSAQKLWLWFAGALVLGLDRIAAPASAQTSGAGVFTGVLTDASSKKPIADAVVTATSPVLQGEEVVVTDSAGFYRIPNLPPGTYTIRFDKEAYKPYSRDAIELRADATLRINIEMLPEAI